MNVLVAHNVYQQPGGEDQVFRQEASLLEEHGHKVIRLEEHNDRVADRNKLQLIADTMWNRSAYKKVSRLIEAEKIQLLHVHNTFPLLSPAIYHAATAHNVPVVQTLHNYRLICPAATLFRDGHLCEECVGKVPFPAIQHKCYRGSRMASALTAAMLTGHRALGSYDKHVSRYIALSEYVRNKFILSGMPAEKIAIKPNFLGRDPGVGSGEGQYCLFAGRLTEEKGVRTLLDAWQRFAPKLPLRIVGQGPLGAVAEAAAAQSSNIQFSPWVEKPKLLQYLKGATLLIVPSLWYEPFSVTLLEAFATGLPVVASRLGTLASLVEHGRTGLHFTPGDPADLAAQVDKALEDPVALRAMRKSARHEFEMKYTGQINYRQLMNIYAGARSEVEHKAA